MKSWWMVCASALLLGCNGENGAVNGGGGTGGDGGAGGVDPSPYASKDMWLCRPDIEDDQCDTADLRFTEIRADGSTVTGDVPSNPDAPVDCFYVYHTVNNSQMSGNTEELSVTDPDIVAGLNKQGAHFRGVCRMFAPLYHQMTIGVYSEHPFGAWKETEFFERAYGDVVQAFDYYMENFNAGRGFVLLGHSQGPQILTTLLEERFDEDEALHAQLVSAVLGGPCGPVQIPPGEVVGGTYANIPLCTSAAETGCIVAFDAVAAGVPNNVCRGVVVAPPLRHGCVNPASIGGPSTGVLAALMFPSSVEEFEGVFPDTVETEWVRYPGIYESSCNEAGALEVDLVDGDPREPPFTPQELQEAIVASGSAANLHWGEPYMTVADLVRIVEMQSANR